MATNTRMESCVADERGALVFWSPDSQQRKPGSRVQIIDVFSLQVVSGYISDPQGRLLLESQPSVGAGRSWSLAKAAQLIRNDARPHRWVALQLNKHAWGLFWAGGGLQHCRALLAERISKEEATSSAIVPATPEALLRLVLDLQNHGAGGAGSLPMACWNICVRFIFSKYTINNDGCPDVCPIGHFQSHPRANKHMGIRPFCKLCR